MELKPGERIDDLQLDGLYILQKKDGFRFGMDAVLLADFTRTRPRERIADLGTGTGILPLLLSHQQRIPSLKPSSCSPIWRTWPGVQWN